MGNEGADLDSIFSAIALAFHRTHFAHTNPRIYIPIINMHLDDFDMKIEVKHHLKLMNINKHLLDKLFM